MASVAGRPKRQRQDPIGSIAMRPGRQEFFNLFPAIMARWPVAVSEIVVETTEELGRYAQAIAPVQGESRGRPPGSWNGRRDVAPGTLKRSMKTRYFKRRGTDITVTGRVDFKAIDPTAKDSRHTFAKAVEVGSVRVSRHGGHYSVPAEPFLVPAIEVERPIFVERLMGLEGRL
ncbi:MAG TPA: hypothetical protein VIM25_06275 [Candidatus Limnocylindrales bacterium]